MEKKIYAQEEYKEILRDTVEESAKVFMGRLEHAKFLGGFGKNLEISIRGRKFYNRLRDIPKNIGNMGADIRTFNHHRNVKNKINIKSIGKWKQNLTSAEQVFVENELRKNLQKQGYIE